MPCLWRITIKQSRQMTTAKGVYRMCKGTFADVTSGYDNPIHCNKIAVIEAFKPKGVDLLALGACNESCLSAKIIGRS